MIIFEKNGISEMIPFEFFCMLQDITKGKKMWLYEKEDLVIKIMPPKTHHPLTF